MGTGVAAGGAQISSIRPSWAVSRMPRTAAGTGPRLGTGVGATVNVQVASWSATATALPASSGDSNTTCGQSNAVPLMHAGISRMIFSRARPVSSASRSLGSRPIPTGSTATGERLPKSLS